MILYFAIVFHLLFAGFSNNQQKLAFEKNQPLIKTGNYAPYILSRYHNELLNGFKYLKFKIKKRSFDADENPKSENTNSFWKHLVVFFVKNDFSFISASVKSSRAPPSI